MGDAWAWLTNASGGAAKTDKCLLVGGSMGGLMAVNWAYRNPTKVAAVALIIPVLDLEDVYTNNRGGLASQITAAYGGAPDYATRSPIQLASGLAGIPTKVWYATDDPVTPNIATNTTFAGSVGVSASTRLMGAVGHTFSAVDADEVMTFLAPYI
jgi:pimeloyl-ACP methyl ester carboxylesterase